eukprot:40868-Eustigmatos_ZCMA.PRE.1
MNASLLHSVIVVFYPAYVPQDAAEGELPATEDISAGVVVKPARAQGPLSSYKCRASCVGSGQVRASQMQPNRVLGRNRGGVLLALMLFPA